MKTFKQHILEKLRVTKNTDIHICKVELDHFIPWLYKLPYHRISALIPDDLIFPGVPFKDTMQKYFNNDPKKLYTFFDNQVKKNPIIYVESIEDYPGVWEFEFTLDNITFKTNTKYKYPLDEWETKYPTDTSLNFFVDESKIDEKLKITKDSYRTGDELFSDVINALKHYPELELDVKPLKLICYQYKEDYSFKTRSIYNIHYKNDPKSKREWMIVTFDNGSSIRIDDFEAFDNTVLSETKESSEEILNNILYLIGKYYGEKYI